jgi:hypothetical protein
MKIANGKDLIKQFFNGMMEGIEEDNDYLPTIKIIEIN